MKKWPFIVVIGFVTVGIAAWWLQERKPAAAPPPRPSYVDTVLSRMSLRDKIASLLIMNIKGTDPAVLASFVTANKLGGFILMGPNIPGTDAALRRETAALRGDDERLPRLVATDEEGGTVKRLPGDAYASALTLKDQPVASTAKAFADRSALVRSVGITLNFGVVADMTDNRDSFIYDRVLGATPGAAADRVAAAVQASKGMTLTTLKHFPGHGETAEDSHQVIPSIPLSYDVWAARDAPPFEAGIATGADVVMMGHLRYDAVDTMPASLSKKWHDILRDKLKFNGVVVTDAMGMLQASGDPAYASAVRNAVLALQAGSTMLLYATDPVQNPTVLIDGIEAAVKKGDVTEALVTRNARAALELRAKSAAFLR